jgi:hypothetical protein
MNELAEGFQECSKMFPGNYTLAEAQAAVNKALAGDKTLLAKIADLPYISQ